MSKLELECGHKTDEWIIRKNKGRLTVAEIMEFMNRRDQLMQFGEGAMCVIVWRTSSDTYSGWDDMLGKAEGDSQSMFVLQDESRCFCGRVLHMQYCPDCGRKLTGGEEVDLGE